MILFMKVISAASRVPFLNPELHAMAYAVTGNHTRAQEAVDRALSAYAIKQQGLDYQEHPWTQDIGDVGEWMQANRLILMEQLWEVLKREEKLNDDQGFFLLGASERIVLFLRARTSLELEQIAFLMQLSTTETVALLERARHELLSRAAPKLLEEPLAKQCRHTLKVEALAALDVERFADDFLVRHMEQCEVCHKHYTEARSRRDAWLAFIPEGEIPRSLQREFEARWPNFLKEVLPENKSSLQSRLLRLGRGLNFGLTDLVHAATRPSFFVTVIVVAVATWLILKN